MITKDIFIQLTSVAKGLNKDKRTEHDFKELNRTPIKNYSLKAQPRFAIKYIEKELDEKSKYYKNTIDAESINKFNVLIHAFTGLKKNSMCYFSYNGFYTQYTQYFIYFFNYSQLLFTNSHDTNEEDIFVLQYLKANMIWLFMELQNRFSKYGKEDIMTVEKVSKYYFGEVLDELEIKPSQTVKASITPKAEIIIFLPIENDLSHRPLTKNTLTYHDIVQYPKSLARAEQMMFEAEIIDKDYNFIYNATRSNKSVLGILYYLFIQKEYFNPIRKQPNKKITTSDIVNFLINRYNTNARKQFKLIENNQIKRNELINKEYILKNLPNKMR